MRTYLVTVLLLAAIALAALALLLRNPGESGPRSTENLPETHKRGGNLSLDDVVEARSSLTHEQQDSVVSREAAIANESIFNFPSDEELQRFLEALNKAGIELASVNRTLLSARLSLDKDQMSSARALAGDKAQVEDNYTILTPFPVLPDSNFVGRSFDSATLPFLGVPSDNHEWGKGVTVAILDTGVMPHPNLEGIEIKHIDLIGEGNQAPSEYAPHGTAVASILAGQSGNGISPRANLLSIRVLDSDGIGDTFTLAQGIVEAVDAGANIINMSLGGFGDSYVLRNAIDYAAEQGVVMVAAVGNEGLSALPYPAQYDGVVAVSAIDADERYAPFSNSSMAVDLSAPGVGIETAWEDEQWVSFTGTSASAPLVSGAIAGLVSLDKNLSPQEATQRLVERSNDIGLPGPDPQTGAGFIDLQRSLYDENDNIRDLALADIHFDSDDAADGELTVHIVAQNRGTEIVNTAYLRVTTDNGIPHTTYLGRLAPGEIQSSALTLHESQINASTGFSIDAQVAIPQVDQDDKPSNDQKRASIGIEPGKG